MCGGALRVLLVVSLLAVAAGCVSGSGAPVVLPEPRPLPPDVAEAIETYRLVDNRPHEFMLHPRDERPRPLVAFNRVLGWTIETDAGVGGFERSDEQQLWGGYVGKVTLPAGAGAVLRPPEPMPIRDRFDSVQIWVTPKEPFPAEAGLRTLEVLVRDADGTDWALPMGAIGGMGWRLAYLRLPPEIAGKVQHPCAFVGLRWSAGPEAQVHYIDSLAIFTELLEPLALAPRPRVPLDWPPGHSPGLHAGEALLPFPVDPNTVVPVPTQEVRRPQVEVEGPRVYRFSGFTEQGRFAYRVEADNGGPVVRAELGRLEVATLFGEGGIRADHDVHEAVAVSRREGDRVRIEYTSGAWYEFRLAGRSLLVDAFLRGGNATRFEAGSIRSDHEVHLFSLPGAPVELVEFAWLTSGEDGNPVFVSRALDAIRGAASEIDPGAGNRLGVPSYLPRSDGRRTDLYERLVLTVAERLEDVLPVVLHAPPARRAELAATLWRDLPDEEGLAGMFHRAATDAEMGLTGVVSGLGETAWRDASDNATFRVRASDRLGADTALADWIAAMSASGTRVGLNIGYGEISALNPHWSEDRLLRDALGGWGRAASGRYRVKAPAALELQEKIAPVLAKRYTPELGYVGTLTQAPPWYATDYDERVPGAGTLSQPWLSIGELLLREREILDAPVVGVGGAWFYAGLADGLVSADEEDLLQAPPYLPFFELTRLQPLSVRFGLGRLAADLPERERSHALDRYLAGQIAYGRNGRLPPPHWAAGLHARAYYSMQALQTRYAGRKAERIAYWDGERYLGASRAMSSGALRRSQLYVLFDNGLEVWVNGSTDDAWAVRVGRTVWTLPPFGWVASGEGLLALSASMGEGRVDFVKGPDYLFWDGRGSESAYAEVASAGPLAIRVLEEDGDWVLDVRAPGGSRRFGLGQVVRQGAPLREVRLFGEGGVALGVAEAVEDEQGLVWVESEAPVWRAVFPLGAEEARMPEALQPEPEPELDGADSERI